MTQKDSALKIGVVGAGAIGGICAGWIKNAGYDVQVVVRTPDHARQITAEGIQITGIKGDLTIKMDAVSRVEDMDGDRDMVLLGVKATSMMEAAEKLKERLKPGAVVVSLQNGFCEEALAGVLGRETVIGCVTGWGATLHSPCRLEMTSPGDFIVGNIDNRPDPRLEEVRAVLDCVLPAGISHNIAGDLYSNASRFNISTPVNTQVLEMVKKIEQGKAGIASENLDKIILG